MSSATTALSSRPAWKGLPRLPRSLRRTIAPLVLVGIWQAACSYGLASPQTLPAPSLIASSFWNLIVTGQLWPNLLISLGRVLGGLAAGITVGTILGLTAGLTRLGEDAIDPGVQMARTLPHLALIPLMILWFGIGEAPKVIIIALGVIFPIYLNLFSAIRGADRKLLEAGSVLGLSHKETIWHVVLPAALPGFLVGLRQSLGIAWISLVVAEQINASSGIGYLVMNARDFLQTDVIFDGLLVYAILGLTTDRIVRSLETHLLAWRPASIAQ
jgi:sulfonate transport system permease protein